jgi:hypothetical protein
MKTSLLLDDHVHRMAGEVSRQTGKSLSEVISQWARLGCELSQKGARVRRRAKLPAVDLGRPARVDLSCRRDWMEMLER